MAASFHQVDLPILEWKRLNGATSGDPSHVSQLTDALGIRFGSLCDGLLPPTQLLPSFAAGGPVLSGSRLRTGWNNVESTGGNHGPGLSSAVTAGPSHFN
jgi:hypothetical protein